MAVPIVVPLIKTAAPTTGKPSSLEMTVPVTFEIWAFARPIPINRQAINSVNFLFINSLLKFNFTFNINSFTPTNGKGINIFFNL